MRWHPVTRTEVSEGKRHKRHKAEVAYPFALHCVAAAPGKCPRLDVHEAAAAALEGVLYHHSTRRRLIRATATAAATTSAL